MAIIAMCGHCDSFDVTYTKIGENHWETEVPADLSDGKYVVEIYGLDETGYIAYWTGILYMFDSRVVMLELLPDCSGRFWSSTDTVETQFWDSADNVEVRVSLVQSCRKGGCVP